MQSLEKDFTLVPLALLIMFSPLLFKCDYEVWTMNPILSLVYSYSCLWELTQLCIPHCDYLSLKTLTIGLVNNIYNITCVYIGFKIGIFGLANNVTKFSKVQPISCISSTCTKP